MRIDRVENDTRSAPAPRERRPSRPVRIEIPSIGVDAPIIGLGLNPDRTLEVPTDYGDAGWWTGGPRPGERGPAVIAGHVDSRTGPAVFFRIGELQPGAKIVVVGRDGTRARFSVLGSERYPKAQFPTARVYGRTRAADPAPDHLLRRLRPRDRPLPRQHGRLRRQRLTAQRAASGHTARTRIRGAPRRQRRRSSSDAALLP